MVVDNSAFKQGCEDFSKFHYKAREVLGKADGKKSYINISEEVKINKTTTNAILKEAERLELATKIKPGVYKKKSGIMKHVPVLKKSTPSKNKTTIAQLINKISKKKIKEKKHPSEEEGYSASFEKKSNKMVDAYRQLYSTENILRELIRKVVINEQNKDKWWRQRIPKGVRDAVGDTIIKLPYDDAERVDNLEYTHLGQLAEIIVNGQNWNDFVPFLKQRLSKQTFQETINRAIPARNAIGHCIPLKGDDLRLSDMRFVDILKMLK